MCLEVGLIEEMGFVFPVCEVESSWKAASDCEGGVVCDKFLLGCHTTVEQVKLA